MNNDRTHYRRGYLTISRKCGEGFHIDENTEVIVTKIMNNRVDIAIKAPGKNVLRNEILANEPRKKES